MPTFNHNISLTDEEMEILKSITHKGSGVSARTIMHANIPLLSNDRLGTKKKTNRETADLFDISPNTVNQARRLYASRGLEAALKRKTRLTPPHVSKITGDFEAQVIATALGPAPQGRARRTLRLLAEYCAEKEHIVSISHAAIGDMLDTNQVKPHLSKYWRVPKEHDAAFVLRMEDVLGICKTEYNPRIPVVCMDEKPVRLLDEIRERVSAKPLRTDPDTGLRGCILDRVNGNNLQQQIKGDVTNGTVERERNGVGEDDNRRLQNARRCYLEVKRTVCRYAGNDA